MKYVVLLILLLPIQVFSQSYTDWNEKTLYLLDSIKSSISSDQYLIFKCIVEKRSTYDIQTRIDTLSSSQARIVEGFDYQKDMYGIKEEYRNSQSEIKKIIDNKSISGVSYDDFEESLNRKVLDTIYPRQYYAVLGCSPNLFTKIKANKIRRKAYKEGEVIESYLKIETFIDVTNNRMLISFLIPVKGQRVAEVAHGPFYWDMSLSWWLK